MCYNVLLHNVCVACTVHSYNCSYMLCYNTMTCDKCNFRIYVLSTQSAHEYLKCTHSTTTAWYQCNDTCFVNHTHYCYELWWSANVQITDTLCVTTYAVHTQNLSCILNRTHYQFAMSIMLSYVLDTLYVIPISCHHYLKLSVYHDHYSIYFIWQFCTLFTIGSF